jgi:hypothetical protein
VEGGGSQGLGFSWRVQPWRVRRARAGLLAATVLALSFLVHVAFGHVLFDLATVVAFGFVTREFWLPVSYTLTPSSVEIRPSGRTLRYRLNRFARFRVAPGSLTLSDAPEGRGAERRLVLPLPSDQEEPIREYLRDRTELVDEAEG